MDPAVHPVELAIVALSISLDSFAASLALGPRAPRHRRLPIALTFALFGGAFPLVGVQLGAWLAGPLRRIAEALSAVVLAGVGGWMLHSARTSSSADEATAVLGRGRGAGLPLLAAGLSTDNLAVGLGLGLHGMHTAWLGAAAAASVFCATYLGLVLGRHGWIRFRRRALAAAGVLLLCVALALVVGWI
jgi:manganese efflux pump family protein